MKGGRGGCIESASDRVRAAREDAGHGDSGAPNMDEVCMRITVFYPRMGHEGASSSVKYIRGERHDYIIPSE